MRTRHRLAQARRRSLARAAHRPGRVRPVDSRQEELGTMAAETQSVYDIPFLDAEGRSRTLREFRGDVLLIVNTASY